MMRCVSIILAAGNSSRLGRPKQLLKIGGETLLRRTVRLAIEAGCMANLVVLGAFADQFEPELAGLDSRMIVNPDWRDGMGTSICTAMRAIEVMSPPPQTVLLMVCDQPGLRADVLRQLIAVSELSEKGIAASRYAGSAGVPALFHEKYFSALASLAGEEGAKQLLKLNAADVVYLDFPEGSFDVDTETDAEKLKMLESTDSSL